MPSKDDVKRDDDGNFVIENVPVFDAHVTEEEDPEGNERKVEYNAEVLQGMVDTMNQRIEDTGNFTILTDRHNLTDQEREQYRKDTGSYPEDPQPIGTAGNYQLKTFGKKNPRPCITADLHYFPDKFDYAMKRPHRSVEVWLEDDPKERYFEPIAILPAGDVPRRDLGLVYSKYDKKSPKWSISDMGIKSLQSGNTVRIGRYAATFASGSNTYIPGLEDDEEPKTKSYSQEGEDMHEGFNDEQLAQIGSMLGELDVIQWAQKQMEVSERDAEQAEYDGDEETPDVDETIGDDDLEGGMGDDTMIGETDEVNIDVEAEAVPEAEGMPPMMGEEEEPGYKDEEVDAYMKDFDKMGDLDPTDAEGAAEQMGEMSPASMGMMQEHASTPGGELDQYIKEKYMGEGGKFQTNPSQYSQAYSKVQRLSRKAKRYAKMFDITLPVAKEAQVKPSPKTAPAAPAKGKTVAFSTYSKSQAEVKQLKFELNELKREKAEVERYSYIKEAAQTYIIDVETEMAEAVEMSDAEWARHQRTIQKYSRKTNGNGSNGFLLPQGVLPRDGQAQNMTERNHMSTQAGAMVAAGQAPDFDAAYAMLQR